MSRKRRLGRGLEALLGAAPEQPSTQQTTEVLPQQTSAPQQPVQQGTNSTEQTTSANNIPTNSVVPQTIGPQPTQLSRPQSIEPQSLRLHTPDSSPENLTPVRQATDPPTLSVGNQTLTDTTIQEIDLQQIVTNPFQPRKEFDEAEIQALSESLKEHDLLQPILLRATPDGTYELIAGERRFRAAQRAGWKKIPAQVRQAEDRQVAELAIVENLQRKDLNPLEKALSFERYLTEHGATQDELARRLKLNRSTITNLLRLLELPQSIQEEVTKGRITAGHARSLLAIKDPIEQQTLCQTMIAQGWSVRKAESEIQQKQLEQQSSSPVTTTPAKNRGAIIVSSFEQKLQKTLGTKISIKQGAKGNGKISIDFKNGNEFERLYKILSGQESLQQVS
ncbi:MAG: ParB/RepB/Spo0J family partition protein [Pirellulaceae bacterium]|nr:ParB/RepB/Spo0J family partition protein [Pirellulaceae bacterium]